MHRPPRQLPPAVQSSYPVEEPGSPSVQAPPRLTTPSGTQVVCDKKGSSETTSCAHFSPRLHPACVTGLHAPVKGIASGDIDASGSTTMMPLSIAEPSMVLVASGSLASTMPALPSTGFPPSDGLSPPPPEQAAITTQRLKTPYRFIGIAYHISPKK